MWKHASTNTALTFFAPKAFVCDLGGDSWGPNGGHAMFIDLNNVQNKWNGVWCDYDHTAERKFICKALSG